MTDRPNPGPRRPRGASKPWIMRFLVTLTLLAVPAAAWAQGTDENHRRVYDKAVPSVVAIRAMAPLGERSGSGIVLDAEGLILTSYAVVPDGATKIRVWAKGPKLYDAEIVATSRRDEITLIRIKPKAGARKPSFTPAEFGDSSKIQIGDACYSLGNASNSMINDDSPSFQVGVVSGVYALTEEKENATYTGHVFETTAAVNFGMEGGALLDAKGRVVGILSMNYSASRFLGVAIPWSLVKDRVELLKDKAGVGPTDEPVDTAVGEGSFGATVVDGPQGVTIDKVESGGPADRAGLAKGVIILKVGEVAVRTAKDFRDRIAGLQAGTRVFVRVNFDGLEDDVVVELKGAKK